MRYIKSFFFLKREIKDISKLAMPTMAVQLAIVALGTADVIMIGMLGTQSIATGGLAIAIFSLLQTFGSGIMSAISNIISFEHGKNPSSTTIGRVVRAGFILAILLSFIFYIMTWGVKPILMFSGQDTAIIMPAIEYLQIMLIGMPAFLWLLVLRYFSVGIRQPGKLLVFAIISVILKIIFNYIFMFGAMGIPAQGLMGVAWSSNIVYLCTFLMFAYSVAKNPLYKSFELFSQVMACKYNDIISIVRTGLPIAITYVSEASFFMVIALLMGHIGEVALATHTIVYQCEYITFMLANGIANSASMYVGNAYGSGKYISIRRYTYASLLIGFICLSITGLSFWLLNNEIMYVFIKETSPLNDKVYELGLHLLIVAAIFQIFDGLQNITIGCLRGIKAIKSSMWIPLLCYWLIALPLAYIFGIRKNAGAIGIWWGIAFSLLITLVLLIFCFEKRYQNIKNK
jgi:multidrug resistance protein, MATE family